MLEAEIQRIIDYVLKEDKDNYEENNKLYKELTEIDKAIHEGIENILKDRDKEDLLQRRKCLIEMLKISFEKIKNKSESENDG